MGKEAQAAPDTPQFITLTPDQLQQLIGNRDTDEFLRKQAQYQAEANKKALRPENEQHPGISVYRPEGRKDELALRCKTYWVGYPLLADNLTEVEIGLLNQIDRVGEYPFTKSDGSVAKLTVSGERDANGKLSRLLFDFPCKGDDRYNLPAMASMLREVIERQRERA